MRKILEGVLRELLKRGMRGLLERGLREVLERKPIENMMFEVLKRELVERRNPRSDDPRGIRR